MNFGRSFVLIASGALLTTSASQAGAEEESSLQMAVGCFVQSTEIVRPGGGKEPYLHGVGPQRQLATLVSVEQDQKQHTWNVVSSKVIDFDNVLEGSLPTRVEFVPKNNSIAIFFARADKPSAALLLMPDETGKTGLNALLSLGPDLGKMMNGRCMITSGAKSEELLEIFSKKIGENVK